MNVLIFRKSGIYFICDHSVLLTGVDAIAAAALASPCVPLEVQPVHVQGLHMTSASKVLVVECGSLRVIIMVPSRSKKPLLSY